MRILQVDGGAEAGESIVGDLQDKSAVHHAVAGLEVPVGYDDAVVQEEDALEENEERSTQGEKDH